MRKLLNGERRATPLQMILAVGILLGCLALGLFAYSARSTAIDSQRIAKAATASENSLRATIVDKCQQRLAYDQRFVASAKDDVSAMQSDIDSYKLSLKNAEIALKTPTVVNDPQLLALEKSSIKIIQDAIVKKETSKAKKVAIVDQGVIGNCDDYAKDQ